MGNNSFVGYLVNKFGLEEDKYLLERTFENLEFDNSPFYYGTTNNHEVYVNIHTIANLDDKEVFDSDVIINIGKDPNLHKILVKLCFIYKDRFHVISVSADENDIKMSEKSNILRCGLDLYGENTTELYNSYYINDTSMPDCSRFDLQILDHYDVPMKCGLPDYDREVDKNIISATMRWIKENKILEEAYKEKIKNKISRVIEY